MRRIIATTVIGLVVCGVVILASSSTQGFRAGAIEFGTAGSEGFGPVGDLSDLGPFVLDEVVVKLRGLDKFTVKKIAIGQKLEQVLSSLRNDPTVEFAEPNYYARALYVPNDPYYSYQWHMQNAQYGGIDIETAWDKTKGAGATIAVIDTGVAYETYRKFAKAPDLAETSFVPGYDFVGNDTHPNDDNGHGTHVAGTIAQSTNNALGVAGAAFQARIMPIKVLDRRGVGTYAAIANGIIWATDHGANVINLSLGGGSGSQTLESALAYAKSKNVTIVAAAGNDGQGSISYPARYDQYVLAIGATRFNETLAPYSNYGTGIDLVAPGGDINVDQNRDGYGDGVLQETFAHTCSRSKVSYTKFAYCFYQGTSMATPHAAAVAGLIYSMGVSSVADVWNILETSAKDLGSSGYDTTYGYGRVNAVGAVQKAALLVGAGTTTPSEPTPPAPEPPASETITSTVVIERLVAFDAIAGRFTSVGLVIANEGSDDVRVDVRLDVVDPAGRDVAWSGEGERAEVGVSLIPGQRKNVWFKTAVPVLSQPGEYIARATVLDETGNVLAQESSQFEVTSRRAYRSAADSFSVNNFKIGKVKSFNSPFFE